MSENVTREAIIAAAEQAMAADAGVAADSAEPAEPPASEPVAAPEPVTAEPAVETASESKLGAIIRAKKDAKRIRDEAAREREAIAKERAELEALRAALKENPLEGIKRLGVTLEDVTRGVVAEGSPEAELARIKRELESERKARESWQAQIAERERATAEQAFISVATSKPTLGALYADEPQELVQKAYAVQQAYYEKTGMVPTREEIAEYLEEVESRRYARLTAKQTPARPPAQRAPSAPVRQQAPKDFHQMTPSEQRRHLIRIAEEAQKSYRAQQ